MHLKVRMVKQYKNRQSDLHGDSLKFCIVTFSKMPWMGCWRFCRSVLHNENTAIYVITSRIILQLSTPLISLVHTLTAYIYYMKIIIHRYNSQIFLHNDKQSFTAYHVSIHNGDKKWNQHPRMPASANYHKYHRIQTTLTAYISNTETAMQTTTTSQPQRQKQCNGTNPVTMHYKNVTINDIETKTTTATTISKWHRQQSTYRRRSCSCLIISSSHMRELSALYITKSAVVSSSCENLRNSGLWHISHNCWYNDMHKIYNYGTKHLTVQNHSKVSVRSTFLWVLFNLPELSSKQTLHFTKSRHHSLYSIILLFSSLVMFQYLI